ncbi:copper oxidase, partial [Rhizobium brockwellii]
FLNGLMVGAAALGTSVAVRPLRTWAQVAAANTSPASRSLSIGYRTIDVMGRSAQVFGLVRPDGRPGLEVEAGTDFDLSLSSAIDEPTL